ncbi:efflux RND transporter permease subunit [Tumebacillus permanentifrigoris]|uniref:HAE1 family hydrophobic/amphiphilic exporter-1 n=1 Tax=Tumebacillus permanentifrigoris TaxID=378543 RepID=A0A316DA32_9BACL|nr:efflux RND transporter permease subunit [Tumebacillus permanentifrigoris]PWK14341.1 HAE1 family hydrophobic/amphiphilic exporter-1 [Tumebacillus permanentifrigoris]
MRLSELSVKRPVAAVMIIVALVILGGVSLFRLPVELFPRMTFPLAAVTVQSAGTGPEVIETMITRPLEEILGTANGVKNIASTTRNGGTMVLVEFDWGTNMDYATLQMREKIDYIKQNLPEGTQTPVVIRFDPNLLPVVQLGMTGGKDLQELGKLANETVKRALSRVEGVAAVQISGGAEREVRITVHPYDLQARGLTLEQLRQILASENLTLSGGLVREADRNMAVIIRGDFPDIESIRNLPLASTQGNRFHLRDVADVEETLQDQSQISRMNGQPSVAISIQKLSDANTVQVSNGLREALTDLKSALPANVQITPLFDQASFIKQSIRTLSRDMLLGGMFAVVILYVFLRSWRSTLVISLAIPVSIIATFIMVYFSGQSVNMLTMGGLALGVGAMVDTAVVILENIFRHRQMGRPLYEAVLEGSSEVTLAVTSAAFASVVVFAPIIFVSGLAAQLIRPLALTVTFSHLASLFSALLLVPMFAYYFLRGEKTTSPVVPAGQDPEQNESLGRLSLWYRSILHWALNHRKTVYLTTLLLLGLTAAAYPLIGQEFLPKGDQGVIQITMTLSPGTPLDKTGQRVTEIEQKLSATPELDKTFVTIGGGTLYNPTAGTQSHKAVLNLQLKDRSARTRSTVQVADDLRVRLTNIPDARVNVQVSGDQLTGAGMPIQVRLRGDDPDVLRQLAQQATQLISHVAGVREAAAERERLTREIVIVVDREKARNYGLGNAQVAQMIRQATQGQLATQYRTRTEEVDVRLQIPVEMRNSLERLRQLQVPTPLGTSVALGTLADVQLAEGPSTISRYNNLREMTVEADYIGRDIGHIMDDIRKTLGDQLKLPAGYAIEYGGESEQMSDAFKKLEGALVLAIVLVYMVMAAQFESFFHPFVIMFSIPVTAVGVVFGLLVTGRALGVGAFIGLIVLVGIVVNNAIILIDYVNRLRRRGLDRVEAILRAGPVRLRPILMTAGATVLGVVPASLGLGEGAEIQAPLATVVLFGLTFSTLITLVLIPVVYLSLDSWLERRQARR